LEIGVFLAIYDKLIGCIQFIKKNKKKGCIWIAMEQRPLQKCDRQILAKCSQNVAMKMKMMECYALSKILGIQEIRLIYCNNMT
jgi:hypothetical protein